MNGGSQQRFNKQSSGDTRPARNQSPHHHQTPHVDLKATIACPFQEAITTWAQQYAQRLASDRSNTVTALRRFFNEFTDMAAECRDTSQAALPPHVATRLKMLIPRALYAMGRQNAAISKELAHLVVNLANYSSSPKKLAEARDIFEAVLGYAVGFGIRNR